MKVRPSTVSAVIFTAVATTAFGWVAQRPAATGHAVGFAMPPIATAPSDQTSPPVITTDTPVGEASSENNTKTPVETTTKETSTETQTSATGKENSASEASETTEKTETSSDTASESEETADATVESATPEETTLEEAEPATETKTPETQEVPMTDTEASDPSPVSEESEPSDQTSSESIIQAPKEQAVASSETAVFDNLSNEEKEATKESEQDESEQSVQNETTATESTSEVSTIATVAAVTGTLAGVQTLVSTTDNNSLDISYTPAENAQGTLILLHGCDYKAETGDLMGSLKTGLTKKGWNTLSFALPSLSLSSSYNDLGAIMPEVATRLESAITMAKAKSQTPVLLLGHSCGSHMALAWMEKRGSKTINGYIGMGTGFMNTAFEDSAHLRIPIEGMKVPQLDIYGSKDHDAVLATQPERLSHINRAFNSASRQKIIEDGDHQLSGKNDAVLGVVTKWLSSLDFSS